MIKSLQVADNLLADSSFLKPHSREVLRQDILNVCLLHARLSFLFADSKVAAKAHFRREVAIPLGLSNPEDTPQELGLRYEDVRWTDFAQAMERQYNYAFDAVIGGPGEPMEYETTHTWAAAILLDLQQSLFVYELGTYGGGYWEQSIERCLYISELANARLCLETGEVFTHLRVTNGRDEGTTSSLELTVRQLALLAGMEEMSVRTAASRRGPNPLAASKDGPRTVFERSVAKEWLLAKGRYMPVRNSEQISVVDTMARSYADIGQFIEMVQSILDAGRIDGASYQTAMHSEGLQSLSEMQAAHLRNPVLMRAIATSLNLPQALFVLRAQEAATREELRALEEKAKELRSLMDGQ
jgi:hypothetical protein